MPNIVVHAVVTASMGFLERTGASVDAAVTEAWNLNC